MDCISYCFIVSVPRDEQVAEEGSVAGRGADGKSGGIGRPRNRVLSGFLAARAPTLSGVGSVKSGDL